VEAISEQVQTIKKIELHKGETSERTKKRRAIDGGGKARGETQGRMEGGQKQSVGVGKRTEPVRKKKVTGGSGGWRVLCKRMKGRPAQVHAKVKIPIKKGQNWGGKWGKHHLEG